MLHCVLCYHGQVKKVTKQLITAGNVRVTWDTDIYKPATEPWGAEFAFLTRNAFSSSWFTNSIFSMLSLLRYVNSA